jgi:hypothetical protein
MKVPPIGTHIVYYTLRLTRGEMADPRDDRQAVLLKAGEIMFMVVFTMLFSGGMIPTFLVVKALWLVDTYAALVVPTAINAPEFWGRSLGWYGMALSDFLDLLPDGHPGGKELKPALGRFVDALIRFQDGESGLWHQVVDKGERPDNWLETSCSSLFVYTIAKAVRHGCAGEDRMKAAWRGYRGLTERVRYDERGRLIVPDICVGTAAGDYAHYVARPVSDNDLHGVGAFILACVEISRANERFGSHSAVRV